MRLSPLQPLRFDKTPKQQQQTVRAPKRGVYINGLRYRPGEEVPQDRLERLPEEDRSRLEAEALPEEDFEKVNNRLSESSGMPSVHTPGLTSKQKAKARRLTLQLGGAYESPGQQKVEDPEAGRKGLPKHAATAKKRASEEVRRLLPELNLPPEIAQHLSKDEEAELSWKGAREVVKLFNQLPSEQELAAMARAGESARGWYEKAAPALRMVFGEDTDKFVALLAATSPRVPVQDNFKKALIVWEKFQQVEHERASQGKPPMSKDEVRKWLVTLRPVVSEEHAARHDKNAKRGGAKKGDLKVSGGEYPYLTPAKEHAENYRAGEGQIDFFAMHDKAIAAALTSSDPGNEDFGVLGEGGAYKIDSFRRNLLGNLWAITNDVWQSLALGVDQGVFGKAHGYMAANAKIRRTAQMMNANLGPNEKKWSPAEVQETIWSFCRSLAMLNGRSRMPKHKGPGKRFPEDQAGLSPMEALQQLTRGDVADTVNFLSLMLGNTKDAKNVRTRLERLGYGEALAKVRRLYAGQGGPANADAPAAAPADFPLLERAAREAARVEGNAKRLTFQRLKFAAGEPMQAPVAAPAAAPAPMPPAAGLAPVQQPAQPNPQDEHKEHLLAYSPNLDDLTFEEALARVRSGNHKAFKKIVQHINEQIGLKAQLSDAVGDWEDGAENSILQKIDAPVDQKTADYLAAWYGLLANQKAVLAFTPSHNGLDSVYQIDVPSTDLGAIRKSLTAAGIPFRTLVPSGKKTTVVIFDEKRGLRDQVAKWAGSIGNAPIRESIGSGRFIGGGSRADARAKYRKIITAYEAAASKSGGQIRSYRPPALPHHVRAGEAAEGKEKATRLSRLGRPLKLARPTVPPRNERLASARYTGHVLRNNHGFSELRGHLQQVAQDYPNDKRVQGLVQEILRGHVEQMPILGDLLTELEDDRDYGPRGMYDHLEGHHESGLGSWKQLSDTVLRVATNGIYKDDPEHGYPGPGQYPHWDRAVAGKVNRTEPEGWTEPTEEQPAEEQPQQFARGEGRREDGSIMGKIKDVATRVGEALLNQIHPDSLPKGFVKKRRQEKHLKRYPEDRDKMAKFARGGVHAPAGGVVVRGLYYPGGKWIPSANLEKASYEQYQNVENQRAQRAKYARRPDGSVSVDPALESEGAEEALKMARNDYTPGVDPRVEKIRAATGRQGYQQPAPKPSRPLPSLGGVGKLKR